MKALTVKNPWAWLICSGIKDIENRTWPTKYRGRILIHASAQHVKYDDAKQFFTPEQYSQITKETEFVKLTNSAIIGSVEIVDCVINHQSIWAEGTISMEYPIYNWVLAYPILFPEPIPAKGKLSFWDYPNILAEPEEKYGPLFCHCQLPVKESNQVIGYSDDFRCRYCGGRWYK